MWGPGATNWLDNLVIQGYNWVVMVSLSGYDSVPE